jgi:hypothetical protein
MAHAIRSLQFCFFLQPGTATAMAIAKRKISRRRRLSSILRGEFRFLLKVSRLAIHPWVQHGAACESSWWTAVFLSQLRLRLGRSVVQRRMRLCELFRRRSARLCLQITVVLTSICMTILVFAPVGGGPPDSDAKLAHRGGQISNPAIGSSPDRPTGPTTASDSRQGSRDGCGSSARLESGTR